MSDELVCFIGSLLNVFAKTVFLVLCAHCSPCSVLVLETSLDILNHCRGLGEG